MIDVEGALHKRERAAAHIRELNDLPIHRAKLEAVFHTVTSRNRDRFLTGFETATRHGMLRQAVLLAHEARLSGDPSAVVTFGYPLRDVPGGESVPLWDRPTVELAVDAKPWENIQELTTNTISSPIQFIEPVPQRPVEPQNLWASRRVRMIGLHEFNILELGEEAKKVEKELEVDLAGKYPSFRAMARIGAQQRHRPTQWSVHLLEDTDRKDLRSLIKESLEMSAYVLDARTGYDVHTLKGTPSGGYFEAVEIPIAVKE